MMRAKLALFAAWLVANAIAASQGYLFAQLLLIAQAGVFLHYLNGVDKQHITAEPLDYICGAFANTLASLGGCVLAVFGILQADHPDTLTAMMSGAAFTAGYTSNSLLNKPP